MPTKYNLEFNLFYQEQRQDPVEPHNIVGGRVKSLSRCDVLDWFVACADATPANYHRYKLVKGKAHEKITHQMFSSPMSSISTMTFL